jgi:hypothetical protein
MAQVQLGDLAQEHSLPNRIAKKIDRIQLEAIFQSLVYAH